MKRLNSLLLTATLAGVAPLLAVALPASAAANAPPDTEAPQPTEPEQPTEPPEQTEPPVETEAPGAGLGTISGTVTASDSGEPLQSVNVYLSEGGDPASIQFAEPDSDGAYSFESLPPGSYTVCFEPIEVPYFARCWQQRPWFVEFRDDIVLGAGDSFNASARLIRFSISGLVADAATGASIRGVLVELFHYRSDNWVKVDEQTTASWYEFELSEPGAYRVCFDAARNGLPYESQCWSPAPREERGRGVPYSSTAAGAGDISISAFGSPTLAHAALTPLADTPAPAGDGADELPATGFDVAWVGALAALALLAGVFALTATRRRL